MKPSRLLSLLCVLSVALPACQDKKPAMSREAAENQLGVAAWELEGARTRADSPDSTPASGVDYADAKRKLESALNDAIEAGVENPGLIVSEIEAEGQKRRKESEERIRRIKAGTLTN